MRNSMGNVENVPRIFPDFKMFEVPFLRDFHDLLVIFRIQDDVIPEMDRILVEIFDKESPMFRWENTSQAIGGCIKKSDIKIHQK